MADFYSGNLGSSYLVSSYSELIAKLQEDYIQLINSAVVKLENNINQVQEQLSNKMDQNQDKKFMNNLKKEMGEAAFRSAGTQITNLVKQGILAMLKDKGSSEEQLSVYGSILESEIGTALISTVLGHGLPFAPMIGADPRAIKMASEFRTAGYATGMNVVFENLMKYILPGISQVVQTLPNITNASDNIDVDSSEFEKVKQELSEPKMRVSSMSESMPCEEEGANEEYAQKKLMTHIINAYK